MSEQPLDDDRQPFNDDRQPHSDDQCQGMFSCHFQQFLKKPYSSN